MFWILIFNLSTGLGVHFVILQSWSGVIVITLFILIIITFLLLENVFPTMLLSFAIQRILTIFDWWSTNGIWNIGQNISALHSVAVILLWSPFFAVETLMLHHCYTFDLIFEHVYPIFVSFLHFNQVFL